MTNTLKTIALLHKITGDLSWPDTENEPYVYPNCVVNALVSDQSGDVSDIPLHCELPENLVFEAPIPILDHNNPDLRVL